MLSHNHVITAIRAIITKALWNLPDIAEKNITFCTEDGKLSLTAVAATVHGEQIQAIVNGGVLCEVLSWQMDVEEPNAAQLIRQAMNEFVEMAMRTPELTAISVLTGEIIIQMSMDVSQKVCFQTVVDRVKKQLGPAVADPELVGSSQNNYR